MDLFQKNRILIIVIVILIVLNLGTLGTLWFGKFLKPVENMPKPPGFMQDKKLIEPLDRELGFDDEQTKKLEEIRKQHFDKMKVLNDEIHSKKKLVIQELTKENPDQSNAQKIIEEIGLIQNRIETEMFNHFLSIKMLCRDEQKEKFNKLMNDIMQRKKPEGFQKRPPHPMLFPF